MEFFFFFKFYGVDWKWLDLKYDHGWIILCSSWLFYQFTPYSAKIIFRKLILSVISFHLFFFQLLNCMNLLSRNPNFLNFIILFEKEKNNKYFINWLFFQDFYYSVTSSSIVQTLIDYIWFITCLICNKPKNFRRYSVNNMLGYNATVLN